MRKAFTPLKYGGAFSETLKGEALRNLEEISFLVDLSLFEKVQMMKDGDQNLKKLLLRPINSLLNQNTFDRLDILVNTSLIT